MSKKRGKSSSAAGQGRWEAALMASAFEEDTWKVNVQFVIESDLLDEAHIKALANVVKIPQRRMFSFLLKSDLMDMVSELGNPKNKKPAKIPQFYEITEIIYGLMNADQDVPLPLWAKLIKFGLLNIKENDLRRRENESKAKDEKEKGKGSGKKRARSKSPGKKGKKTPEPQLPKKDWSTLKKRGDDDDDSKYVDDEPDDGPQHYIFVGGFKKPQLLPILGELGVNINGVIRIQSESYDVLARMVDEKVAAEGYDEDALAKIHSQRELDVKELALFWKLLPIVLQRSPPTSRLQDLAMHQYTVTDTIYPTDWENQDNMVGFGTTIFEDMACKIYDSLDWERQYLNYLKNMNLLNVPEFGKPDQPVVDQPGVEPRNVPSATGKREKGKAALEPPQTTAEELVPPITPPVSQEVDTRYYRDLMDCIPMESVSVPLVMHCMLEQVVATEKDKIPPSEQDPPSRTDGIHLALAECIAESLEGLCLSEEDEQALANDFPQYKQKREMEMQKNKTPQGPVLLHYGDDTSVRTQHLAAFDGFKPQESEKSVLVHFPSASLLAPQAVHPYVTNERASRLHELHRYTTNVGKSDNSDVVSEKEVDRALQLFVFESMEVSEADSDGLIRSPAHDQDNAWDDPYTAAAKKMMIESQSRNKYSTHEQEKGVGEESEKIREDVSSKPEETYLLPKRILDNYCYTETFKTPVLLQTLEEARHMYPCMDAYRHKRDNSTLVMFHYPMSDDLQGVLKWSSSLHSDVGFRNYLEYVAGPITDWTKDQEEKYRAELVAKEMEKAKQAADAQAELQATPPSTAKRPRSKSPKKGSRRGSASRSSSKVGASDDGQQFSTPFIRAGSLKAESEIQTKLKEEEERLKKEKESKQSAREKSAGKGKAAKSAASKTSQDGKRPTSSAKRPKSGRRSKSRSRSRSNSRDREEPKPAQVEEPKAPALPFTGYNVGNNLIHINGSSSYLYPCDGGTIKTEKIQYEHGQTSVKTTMYKDGHLFVLHILEPKDSEAEAELEELTAGPSDQNKSSEAAEKGETEAPEKEPEPDSARPTSAELLSGKKEDEQNKEFHSLFGSWCANLCDGMTLSLSSNGPDGVCTAAVKRKEKLLKLLGEIPPASSPTPVPPGMETPKKGKKSPRGKSPKGKSPRGKSPRGSKKGKDADREAEAQKLEEQRLQEEIERKLREAQAAEEMERRWQRMPKFPQLYTSCPDGLSVRYRLDPTSADINPVTNEEEYKLMVRQSYPYKTSGRQETEKSRAKPAMEEVSRTILSDGRVIKLMKDGSTKVLFANGTLCYNAGSGPIITEQQIPVTPHSLPSGVSQPQPAPSEDQRTATSAGSKKGSRGRKSSGKTNPEATATEPSVAGTTGGHGAAAGLEAEAGAKSEAEQEKAASWLTTYMSGEVTLTKPNGTVLRQDSLLCYSATDPVTGEIMYSREDKVVRVDRPDGSFVCDHTDGTRITRYSREDKMQDGEEQGDVVQSGLIWYIRVECPGYASVTFNLSDSSCVTTFGSGSYLLTNIDGTYQLSHWNGGRLDIACDGSVMYTSRPDNDLLIAALSAAEGVENEEEPIAMPKPSQSEPMGSYIMRHNSDICCEAVDQEGNVFQVRSNGNVSMINPNNTTAEGSSHQESSRVKPEPMEHHPPRLFVINNDGTGTELLRYKDVQEYIGDAHLDPTTAVIREPLPEDIKVVGITVMRPHFGNSGDAWVLQKEEQDIIPLNLKTRDLSLMPPKEVKKPGPAFATTVGKGLAVGSAPPSLVAPPAPMCPSALELRQLVQHQPISQDLRRHLAAKVMEFGRAACEQEAQREAIKVHDPRTAEEQMRASDLLSLVLEFDDEGTPRSPDVVPVPSGIAPVHQPANFPMTVPDEQHSPIVKIKYEAAVAPPPVQIIPPPREKLTQADWDRIHRGLKEEKEGRQALKHRDVPAYFDSEQGRAWLLNQAPDMKAAAMQLARDPRRDGTEARMYATNNPAEDRSSISPAQDLSAEAAPSKLRPTNPTPAHASGGGTPTKVRPDNPTPFAAAQQRNARPSNPTPSHAASGVACKPDAGLSHINQQYQPSPIPENPTSAQRREERHMTPQNGEYSETSDNSHHNNMLPLETETSDLILTRSLLYDVTGDPRKERVRLPMSILSDKPGAVPNEKFLEVEEEVRRKVKTSSIAGGLVQGYDKVTERGFQILPPEVIFGVLREGTTYAFTARLRNTGIDLCRFKIKQPPPGTGMRVHYTPGPVAAGMETKLEIEIYAIAVGVEGDSGVGTINHQLEIVTETDILHLPITAVVLPAYDYDYRSESMPSGGKAPGVRVYSSKPPSMDGIVRPLKLSAK